MSVKIVYNYWKDGCQMWSRNCLPFRSTCVQPGF